KKQYHYNSFDDEESSLAIALALKVGFRSMEIGIEFCRNPCDFVIFPRILFHEVNFEVRVFFLLPWN
ncbi:hypothetical protein PENTCL1PPCAC_8660, partial [Pristionchus entomophagus]